MKKLFFGTLLLGAVIPVLIKASPIDVQIDRFAQKYDLGLSAFVTTDSDAGISADFQEALSRDLKFCKVFNLIEKGPLVKGRADVTAWAPLGATQVLAGTFRRGSGGRLESNARVYDSGNGKEVLEVRPRVVTGDPRRLAHEVANEVVKYFTGQAGFFNSKIVYVNDATGRKELYIADYDGRSPRRLTNDNSIAILPRISPDGNKIIFTSYSRGNPDLYIMNTDGSGRQRISAKAGLNVSPSWAPNGQELAITLSINGPPNIYLVDLQGNIKRRLTDASTADTAPCFSPDGNQIVFTSDRAGAPHIYICNLDGTGLRRLTTVGHCDSATWSPDGTTIVYVKSESGNRFDLYSIEVLTGIERRLTWGPGDNENPSWSPDGRFVLFVSTRRGKSELFTMMADGSEQAPLFQTKGQCFTPYWSK